VAVISFYISFSFSGHGALIGVASLLATSIIVGFRQEDAYRTFKLLFISEVLAGTTIFFLAMLSIPAFYGLFAQTQKVWFDVFDIYYVPQGPYGVREILTIADTIMVYVSMVYFVGIVGMAIRCFTSGGKKYLK